MNYLIWLQHFEKNRTHFNHIAPSSQRSLTDAERKLITKSIQQFQRGENSEGKHLYKYAKAFGETNYVDTTKLFIKEEQSHARVLGDFMAVEDIPKVKKDWADDIFRKLRTAASLENSVVVLITAEIIADTFYRALGNATGSKKLKAICEQIIKDEELHINFQSYTLKIFYERRSRLSQLYIRAFHSVLMLGAAFLVWLLHSSVLRAGGYSLNSYSRSIYQEFLRSHRMITGKQAIAGPMSVVPLNVIMS